MKKRYIFGLVMLALLALAGMSAVIYSNWADIKDIFSNVTDIGKKSLKKVDVLVVQPVPTSVIKKDVQKILDIPKDDSKLQKDLDEIQESQIAADAQISALTKSAVDIIQKEGAEQKKKAPKLAAIVVDNVKKKEIKNQKTASTRYADIIKRIEKEKLKASVFLTGNMTEKEKLAKINAIDKEIDIVDTYKLSDRPIWTKCRTEHMIMNGTL